MQLFPELELKEVQLPNGEWVVASPQKPLNKQEAYAVIVAYATLLELLKAAEDG